jgi:hypothetical protein
MNIQTIREFQTRNFRVVVEAVEDPYVDVSWDETGETQAKLASGEWQYFGVQATVFHRHLGEISRDFLGGCIYADPAEFQDHRQCGAQTRALRAQGSAAICGSYFSDMVRTVCREARQALLAARSVRVREVPA